MNMTIATFNKNLLPPDRLVDAVLDTDAYNEIDDQFAIAYMLKQPERINVRAVFAAPFHNERSESFSDGMYKSYDEIKKILALLGREDMFDRVYTGSTAPLSDEHTPILSEAAMELCNLAEKYSEDNPLYVVAIGAITNVASALLLRPEIAKKIVVVWLGANAHHYPSNAEFNLLGDIAAARVVMQSGAPFVQLPCVGVVSAFTVSEPELRYWFSDKNMISDYLVENTVSAAEIYAKGRPWTRVIWDVCAVAWLCGADKLMNSDVRPMMLPTYDKKYEPHPEGVPMRYVYEIRRDALLEHLIKVITK